MTENEQSVDRLNRVEFDTVWKGEEKGEFTAWLARDENLAQLGEAIGFSGMELEEGKTRLDPSRNELICRDAVGDPILIIDQTYEGAHDTSLGRLIKRAAATKAATVVWVADKLSEEHLEVLDWLNRIAQEPLRFFGTEVELWSIGDSRPAPRFNVAVRPVKWDRGA